MKNIFGLPQFKYQPNLYLSDNVIFEPGVCQCCGKRVYAYIDRMYTRFDVNCVCLDCVASGRAASKFDGNFVSWADDQRVSPAKRDELYRRTPGYLSWQGEHWLSCCEDFCAFLGYVGKSDLEEMGIFDEVTTRHKDRIGGDYYNYEWLTPAGGMSGYLFQCLHCGKYHLHVDCD